jgi:hypothetical protein
MAPGKRRKIAGLGGKAAHTKGRAHTFSHDEAVAAGQMRGRRKNQKAINGMTTPHLKQQLLSLLQDSLNENPKRPVSFPSLGKRLGLSRQSTRTLYYQLKKNHPVPPVNKRGVVAKKST